MQLVTTLVGVLQEVETPVVESLTLLDVVPWLALSQLPQLLVLAVLVVPVLTVLQIGVGVTVEAEQVEPIARAPPRA